MTHKLFLAVVLVSILTMNSYATTNTTAPSHEAVVYIQSVYPQLLKLLSDKPTYEVRFAVALADLILAVQTRKVNEEINQRIELAIKYIAEVLEKYSGKKSY